LSLIRFKKRERAASDQDYRQTVENNRNNVTANVEHHKYIFQKHVCVLTYDVKNVYTYEAKTLNLQAGQK